MNTFPKILIVLAALGWALNMGWAAPADSQTIQAIRQATDPSSVIAAYANAPASERNDPNLYGAFVNRMVDLGIPELAYRQAQTLTVLQPDNGLGWAVLAYVDARRSDMTNAVPALQKAAQFAPEQPLVARTAGGIAAWYDATANKSALPENVRNGLATLRSQFQSNATYADAYKAASQAYLAQAASSQPAATNAPYQAAPVPTTQPQVEPNPPLGYASPVYPAPYYSDYAYDYYGGPWWGGPSPWWVPPGYFYGSVFVPFGPVVVFDGHHHHGDFDHNHHGDFHHHTAVGQAPFPHHGVQPQNRAWAMPHNPAVIPPTARVHPNVTPHTTSPGAVAHSWTSPHFATPGLASPRAGTWPGSVPGHAAPTLSAPMPNSHSFAAPSHSFAAPSRSMGGGGFSGGAMGGMSHGGGFGGGGGHGGGGGGHR